MIKTISRVALLLLILVVLLSAVSTIPDITCNGSAIQLAAAGSARWVTVKAFSTNVASVRTGDSLIGSARGAEVAPGQSYQYGYQGDLNLYQLSGLYVYGTSGDKVSVIVGN